MAAKRKFTLRDPETGEVVPGEVGLSGVVVKAPKGVISIDKLTPAQMDELERMAATAGHPVTEGEPEA